MPKRNWETNVSNHYSHVQKANDHYNVSSCFILSLCFGLFAFMLSWFIVSITQISLNGEKTLKINPSPENMWIHVAEHYVNVNDSSDVISQEEYDKLMQMHDDILSGKISEIENPGEEPNLNATRGFQETDYMREHEGYNFTIPVGALMPDNSRCTKPTEMFLSMDEYKAYAARVTADYQNRLNAYKSYQRAVDEPSKTYQAQVEHYRNRNDFSQYIKVNEYNQLLNEFNNKKVNAEDDSEFKAFCNIPFLPIDPVSIYTEYEYGVVDPYIYTPSLYLSSEEQVMFTEFVSEHKVVADAENIRYSTLNNTVHFDAEPSEQLKPIFDKFNALVGKRAVSYKNVLDGTILTYQEYDQLCYNYQEDYNTYETFCNISQDNTNDSKKWLDLSPNIMKTIISLCVFVFVLFVTYILLYSNIRAQNILNDVNNDSFKS